MRINDIIKPILLESKLGGTTGTSWPAYLRNMLNVSTFSLGDKGQHGNGLVLSDTSKDTINGLLDEIEVAIQSNSDANINAVRNKIESTTLSFTDSKNQPVNALIKNIFKSPELKSGPVDSETGERTTKYWNDGEVAETFLGVALYARFTCKNLNRKEFEKVLKQIIKKPIGGGFEIKTGKHGDNPVEMTAINKPANNQAIVEIASDRAKFEKEYGSSAKELLKLIDASISYVLESSKVSEAIARADNEPNTDKVLIKTDGVSDQTGTKADLSLKVGEFERLLSLKANYVKQFGQNTGARFEVIKEFFHTFIPDVDISSLAARWPDMEDKTLKRYRAEGTSTQMFGTVYGLLAEAYKTANANINEKIADPAKTASLIGHLYNGIVHHAQGKETKQTVVVLNPSSKKAWMELDFGTPLLDALKTFRLETKLIIAGAGERDNHVLEVYGRPLNSVAATAMSTDISTPQQAQHAKAVAEKKKKIPVDPELLFQLRSYIQKAGPTLRNIVEMGPLLKDITEVQYIQQSIPANGTPSVDKSAPTGTKTKSLVPSTTTTTTGTSASTQVPAGQNVTTIQGNQVTSNPVNDTSTEYDSEEDPETARLKSMATVEMKAILRNAGLLG
jgi:hypothetical protein